MKTYPHIDKKKDKCIVAFEIENAYIGLGTAVRLLTEVVGVTDVQKRKLLSGSSEVLVKFKYLNRDYIVWEPFGDNSRYWIGPESENENVDNINIIENAFKYYQPPFYRVVIGDILLLRFVKLLKMVLSKKNAG